jgi:hypothetical protein
MSSELWREWVGSGFASRAALLHGGNQNSERSKLQMTELDRACAQRGRAVEWFGRRRMYALGFQIDRDSPGFGTHIERDKNRRRPASAQVREDVWIIFIDCLVGAIAKRRF